MTTYTNLGSIEVGFGRFQFSLAKAEGLPKNHRQDLRKLLKDQISPERVYFRCLKHLRQQGYVPITGTTLLRVKPFDDISVDDREDVPCFIIVFAKPSNW